MLLGAATFAALGMAAVMIIPNAEAAPVVANVLILPLSFISGIWYPLTGAPDWLVDVAKFFPVEHLANALHVAFDPLNHGSAVVGQRPARAGDLAARRHAPGDALLAAGDGALSADLPDRFRVPAARVAGIFAIFISLPAIIGLLGDEPSAGRLVAVGAALVVFVVFFFHAVRGPDGPQAAGRRRARLRHRPGDRRARSPSPTGPIGASSSSTSWPWAPCACRGRGTSSSCR